MVRPIHDAESFTFELAHLFDQDNKVLTGDAPGLSHTALRHKIRKHGLQINRPLRIMTGNL